MLASIISISFQSRQSPLPPLPPSECDIHPMTKARGIPSSRMGFPASLGVACPSFCPSGSYTSSTGRCREPLGQNVSCSVDIPVMADATLWADPFTHIKREVLHDMLAVMTGFRRWIPTINFDEGSSIPLALILQLADKLAPSHITDRFGEAVIFDIRTFAPRCAFVRRSDRTDTYMPASFCSLPICLSSVS